MAARKVGCVGLQNVWTGGSSGVGGRISTASNHADTSALSSCLRVLWRFYRAL